MLINYAFDFYDEFSLNGLVLTRLDIFFPFKHIFEWCFDTEVNIFKSILT